MNRNKSKSKVDRTMPIMHPNAAAIDVGATMHMAAVGAGRAFEPVRSFGTFTADLDQLVEWFVECGVARPSSWNQPASTGFQSLSFSMHEDLPCFLSTRAMPSTCRAQDRCQRRAVPTAAPFVRIAAGELSAEGADCRAASLRASARASAGVRRVTHPAHAKSMLR